MELEGVITNLKDALKSLRKQGLSRDTCGLFDDDEDLTYSDVLEWLISQLELKIGVR